MPTILTLDLGTSYFKAALFDSQGMLLALESRPTPVQHREAARWEMSAAAFRGAVCELLSALRGSAPDAFARAAALSFATQTNSFLVLGGADESLTPIMLWPDERAAGLADSGRTLSDRPGFRTRTGVPALTSQFMLAKLVWLREHQSEVVARTTRLCLLSDYLTLWLTGRHVTEAGAAGLTGALDIHRLEWWDELCRDVGLPAEWLPKVVRAGTDLGPLLTERSELLGLPANCRFVVGCLDQYAGAIGLGAVTPGALCETTGTVLATVRIAGSFNEHPAANVFQGPAFVDGMYYQMAFGDTSANLLEQYRDQLPDRPSFAELDRLAGAVAPGAGGLRSDCGDDVGLRVRAILERVAFALAHQVELLCGESRPREIRSGGGGARSDLWLQIKADVLNVPMRAGLCPEPASLGAAILAAGALGWGGIAELAGRWVQVRASLAPRAEVHRIYEGCRVGGL